MEPEEATGTTERLESAPAAPPRAPAAGANGDRTPRSAPGSTRPVAARILNLLIELGARALALVPRRLRALALAGPQGRIVLRLIFWTMERRLDRAKARSVDAVVHWEIVGRGGRSLERWQVTIRDGTAQASRTLGAEPSLTLKLDRATFIDLVSGAATPPALFMAGDVVLEGDLMLAARLQSLFKVPRQRRH